jgi:TPR repeat protein
MYMLANSYEHGLHGFQEDRTKAIELYARAANLGNGTAHHFLGGIYRQGGDLKKANSTWRPRLLQGMKIQGASLDSWRLIRETWNELLSIGQLQHQQGIILPCMN